MSRTVLSDFLAKHGIAPSYPGSAPHDPAIKRLRAWQYGPPDEIVTLDLTRCNLSLSGFETLVGVLRHDRTIRQLFLDGNNLGAGGGRLLADLLNGNPTLSAVFAHCCHLGDDGINAVAKGMRGNRMLGHLSMVQNDHTDESERSLSEAIRASGNQNLTYVTPSDRLLVGYYDANNKACFELGLIIKQTGYTTPKRLTPAQVGECLQRQNGIRMYIWETINDYRAQIDLHGNALFQHDRLVDAAGEPTQLLDTLFALGFAAEFVSLRHWEGQEREGLQNWRALYRKLPALHSLMDRVDTVALQSLAADPSAESSFVTRLTPLGLKHSR